MLIGAARERRHHAREVDAAPPERQRDLAAVGVAREHEREAAARRVVEHLGLVHEQHDRAVGGALIGERVDRGARRRPRSNQRPPGILDAREIERLGDRQRARARRAAGGSRARGARARRRRARRRRSGRGCRGSRRRRSARAGAPSRRAPSSRWLGSKSKMSPVSTMTSGRVALVRSTMRVEPRRASSRLPMCRSLIWTIAQAGELRVQLRQRHARGGDLDAALSEREAPGGLRGDDRDEQRRRDAEHAEHRAARDAPSASAAPPNSA